MNKYILQLVLLLVVIPAFSQMKKNTGTGVAFKRMDNEQRVDVYINNKLFTAYIYPSTLEKPVLYPLTTSTGITVTRGFPLQPRSGERVDHPHHVGWWFNYGDVNGLDFWNNSYAIPAADKPHYGSIRHVRVVKTTDGDATGVLSVECQWVDMAGHVLLNEETSLAFSGDSLNRRIMRTTRLTAVNGDVKFGDSKEGLCALRVDRAFEEPSETPEVFTDAYGNPTPVAVMNNDGVNGVYRSSEGMEKDAVWGTRASWVSLTATKEHEDISICMFDHPGNPGYPGYWHVRGYGLFAVNNIGHKSYNPKETENTLLVKKGETIVFRHLLLIKSGGAITGDGLKDEFTRFAKP